MSAYNGTVSLQDSHFEEAYLQQRQVTENPVVETRIPPIKSSVVLDTIFLIRRKALGNTVARVWSTMRSRKTLVVLINHLLSFHQFQAI